MSSYIGDIRDIHHKFCLQERVEKGQALLVDMCIQCGQSREVTVSADDITNTMLTKQQARYGSEAWNKRAGYYVGELDCKHQAYLRAEPRKRLLTFLGTEQEYTMISAACVKFVDGGNESHYFALFRCKEHNTVILPLGLNRADAEELIAHDARCSIEEEGFVDRMWRRLWKKPQIMWTSVKLTIKLSNQMPVTLGVRLKSNLVPARGSTEAGIKHLFISWDDCMMYMVTPIEF